MPGRRCTEAARTPRPGFGAGPDSPSETRFQIYGAPCVLGHVVFAGNTLEDAVWKDLDQFLKTRWRHSRGWSIGIAGTAIDSGGREGRTQKVYNFCYPRMDRRVFTIKGLPGKRKV